MEKLTDTGDAVMTTVSPDGRYVFDVRDDGEDHSSIWMRHIATRSSKEILPASEAEYGGITCTPDGSYLYFVRHEPQRKTIGVLYQIPVLGGTPQKLLEDIDSAVTFSPDGLEMAFVRNSSTDANSKLVIAHSDGTNQRVLATVSLPGYFHPAWSPDGKQKAAALFEAGAKNPGRIVALDVKEGKERTLYAAKAQLMTPTWSPDGRHIFTIFYDLMTRWDAQIGVVDLHSGKFRRITNDLNNYSSPSLAVTKDGRQLVVIQRQFAIGLFVLPVPPKTADELKPIDSHDYMQVAWLKDGRLVASGWGRQVATMNADGSNRNVILDANLPILSMSVCYPSGTILFELPNRQTQSINIFRMGDSGGNPVAVTRGKFDQNVACSPDGRFFVYTTLVNGKKTLMRMSLEGGETKQLSDEYVLSAAVSPNNEQVALMIPQNTGQQGSYAIQIIPADGGAPIKSIPADESFSGDLRFSPDGNALYYPVWRKGVANLVRQPLDGVPPTQVTDFKELWLYGYAFNWPSNKLAVTRGKGNADVVVITQQAGQ